MGSTFSDFFRLFGGKPGFLPDSAPRRAEIKDEKHSAAGVCSGSPTRGQVGAPDKDPRGMWLGPADGADRPVTVARMPESMAIVTASRRRGRTGCVAIGEDHN